MRMWKRSVWLKACLVVLAIGASAWALGRGPARIEADEGPSAARAVAAASEATGLSADQLTVARSASLGATGIRQFKLVDAEGNVHGVALDAAGSRVSDEAVEQAVEALDSQGFVGKLEADLADLLKQRADNGPINVIYWVKAQTDEPLRGDGVSDAAYEARLKRINAQIAAAQKPVVDALRAAGHQIVHQVEGAPMIVASSTPAGIRAMEASADVERIYLERVSEPRLNVSRVVVQAHITQARGLSGQGRRVGIVEAGNVGIHPNLPLGQRLICGTSGSVSGHKTNVAGVIQSTNALFRGITPAITIVDGRGTNFSDAQMFNATNCVIALGASAINMSFGNETNGFFDALARFVDLRARQTGRTISVAVSNNCAARMGSPEIAFNVLAVGSFSDRNTFGFADDRHSCDPVLVGRHSAFLDPISPRGDREEPDLVGPGHQITMPRHLGGFVTANGTSFAAPHLTAAAGALVQRNPLLHSRAEQVRAIQMASARHNIEGATRLSERDGAGALMMAAADRVLLLGQTQFIALASFPTGSILNRTFGASVGQRVRVVMAYSHKGASTTQPSSDLDMRVLRPGGASVGTSLSFDNTYEIVEFFAPVTGVYTIRINSFRGSAGTEFIGWAVSRFDS